MSEQASQPQTQALVPLESEFKTIIQLSNEYLPLMEQGSAKAVAAMKEVGSIDDDDDREYVNDLCVNVRNAYTKISDYRKQITGSLDELKKKYMEFERPLSDDKASDYTRLRSLIAAYDQRKIDEKKRIEAEAERKKKVENHYVDLKTEILGRLNNLVVSITKKAEDGSASYFAASTLENFDKRAEDYRKMKPKMIKEDYQKCFSDSLDTVLNAGIIGSKEYDDFVEKLKAEETYDKWNEEVMTLATPIINAWRAKIPELKDNLIKLKNASDEQERERLKREQEAKAKAEEDQRNRELDEQRLAKSRELQSQADLEKLSNDFVQQATVQSAEPTGPVKYVLKFTNHKGVLKALTTIIYQCMAHKDFPGIEKRDKAGNIVKDAHGRPEYIQAVQYWIDFFLKNCDADIPDTEVFEVSKTIIRS